MSQYKRSDFEIVSYQHQNFGMNGIRIKYDTYYALKHLPTGVNVGLGPDPSASPSAWETIIEKLDKFYIQSTYIKSRLS